jgi:hypothetical protein
VLPSLVIRSNPKHAEYSIRLIVNENAADEAAGRSSLIAGQRWGRPHQKQLPRLPEDKG